MISLQHIDPSTAARVLRKLDDDEPEGGHSLLDVLLIALLNAVVQGLAQAVAERILAFPKDWIKMRLRNLLQEIWEEDEEMRTDMAAAAEQMAYDFVDRMAEVPDEPAADEEE